MNTIIKAVLIGLFLGVTTIATATTEETAKKAANPVVVLETTEGKIKLVLFQDKAPISVKNFLDYAESGHYDGTIFHRVIAGFMIQGGVFSQAWQKKPVKAPIKNEANNGLRNKPGTVAMARTGVVDSATSQFFINLMGNSSLDYRGPQGFGYAVFGEVLEGMDVVSSIGRAQTGMKNGRRDVPVNDIVIKSVTVLP
ncbi:MAG: peptidylprolyl isomerase [Pseudomonadales bacterium]|nr:peptidylprolyl isomerase [Pseudomonadales bacterium]